MTLDRLRPMAERAIAPSVSLAQRLGATPNVVSVLAFALAICGGGVFAVAGQRAQPLAYLAGAGLVAANGWLDLIDGALARKTDAAGPAGDMLDHVLDRYADIVIIAGLATGVEQYAIGFAAVTGVVMTSYLGTQSEAAGLDRVYAGLIGRADRLVLIMLAGIGMAAMPDPVRGLTLVGWLLVVLAVVGHATAAQRFYYAYRAL